MKFIIPFLNAVLPVASVAQSQSGHAPGASGVAKTTEVMAILPTAKQGITRQHIMPIIPSEIRETVKLYLDAKTMNVEDRAALYAEVRRILTPGGLLATYDLVLQDGDVVYPAPWARDASTSFLLSEADTRTTLEEAGFKAVVWRDDTQIALDWFKSVMAGSPPSVLNLGLVIGPDFPAITGNLARNIRENRLGVLSAVLTRN
jgi:hypothetical protein